MKLLLLTTDINIVGGIENVMSILCNYFINKYNYNIEIISLYGDKHKNSHFKFDDKIKITFANLEPIKINNKLGEIIKDFVLKHQIKQLLKDREFDIIMTFHGFISIPVILNKLNIKGKIVVTEHNDYYHGIGRIGMLKRRLLYTKADKVVLLTENNKQIYNKFLDNVEVINNPRPFVSNDISNQDNNRIITAGRLEYEKGYDRLIDIFNDQEIRKSNWKLDIYGEGSEKQNIINKIKNYKLENSIRVLPFTSNIKEELLNSDIYVLTSRTEAFPMVLLEAMECGLPCISFDISGPREIIKNGEDGFIVEKDNNDSFTQKLKRLMNDKDMRVLYSRNAKNNIARFDIENIANRWNKLFTEINTL